MSLRTRCPECRATLDVDSANVGGWVACGACRHEFVARPSRYDEEDRDYDRPRRSRYRGPEYEGEGWATGSLIAGLMSLFTFCFAPLGFVVAVAGIAMGRLGLTSRSRGMAVTGIVFSIVGLIFSTGVAVTFVVLVANEVSKPQPVNANKPPRIITK